jgi:hypothetical protein
MFNACRNARAPQLRRRQPRPLLRGAMSLRAALLVGALALLGCSSDSGARDASPLREASSDASKIVDKTVDRPTLDLARDSSAVIAGYGEPCTLDGVKKCATASLFCLAGPSGGNTGFCTQTCPAGQSKQCSGTPSGTAAFCIVTDVNVAKDKGCAFVCEEPGATFTCPGELQCSPTEEPAGSGQHLCLPK